MKTKLFLIILVIQAISCNSQTYIDYVSLAASEIEKGNYNGAIKYLDLLIEQDKSIINAYALRGYAKGQIQDFKGAINDFEAIIELDPKNSTAYDHRGICKKNLKDYEGALADYNKAIELNNKNGEAYNNRAVVKYFFLTDTIGACEDWEKSVNAGYTKASEIMKGKCPNPRLAEYFAKALSETDFYKYVKNNHLSFTIPSGYVKTDVIPNGDMPYQFAIKLKNAEFEARYYIETIPEIKAKLKDVKNHININELFLTFFQTSVMNVSQDDPKILRFETSDVQNEFNTNVGLYSSFPGNSGYSGSYKYVHMMVFHKDNIADIYITFLWNEQSVCDENIEKVFHAMKFVK